MPIQCPTCSRANPADAAYCYYDGRGLNEAAGKGPLGLGTQPFPLPFSFSDGQGCANYNQLVLACDRHWSEARNYLLNGTWKSFFGALGRADLANLAVLSAHQTDPDVGLCHLLERLPADAEALRPPKVTLTATEEDLGPLEPGKDYKFQVTIANQGMLMLRGSIMTDCDWLVVGEQQGIAAAKLFQTRDTYSLSVRVVGSKLRAGKNTLEGQVIVDTNGGRETVVVRATVPVRPFPSGQADNDVLAGAISPREIAVKAKAHPKEAAVLFEQGAVKVWYESNGWTYPIRGTQAKGKGALQQFFEALGLTKPPHLEIDVERIVCQGEAGHRLIKKVRVHTAESRFVHAEAHSNQDWIQVILPQPHGNSVTIPLHINVPSRPGETLEGVVTLLGNGQQRFVVPVTLTVADEPPPPEVIPVVHRNRWLLWSAAGGILFLCLFSGTIGLVLRHWRSPPENAPPIEIAGGIEQPPPKMEAWWDDVPDTHLTASVAALQKAAAEDRPIFERLESKTETDRRQGYEQLAAKLAELASKAEIRPALATFVTECCVYEPSEINVAPLLRGLAQQFPAEDTPFPPDDKGETVERAAFWLRVVCDTVAHKAVLPERSKSLVSELNNVFAPPLDLGAPPSEFKDQAEKILAEQCYHNLLPTAEQSIEQALTIRQVLLEKFARQLKAEFRDPEDVKLLAIGLSSEKDLWPRLEPIFKSCVDSNAINVGFKLIDFYEKANAEQAPRMEALLAARWKAASNPRLTPAARIEAIRKSMAAKAHAAQIAPAERLKQLQDLLAKSPLSAGKPDGQPPPKTLQDSVRLAHASTMACLLFSKDAEIERFDELIGRIPGTEPDRTAEGNKVDDQPRQPEAQEVIDLAAGNRIIQDALTEKNDLDPRRDAYRKVFAVRFKAGEIYILSLRSSDLQPYLRVETVNGRVLLSDRGANAQLTFSPPTNGVYNVIASSLAKKALGRFTLQMTRQQIFRFGMPGMAPGAQNAANAGGEKVSALNLSDLADLAHKQSNVRIAAFRNLARSIPNDLAYRHAQKIAAYLLVTEWTPLEAELDAVTKQLPALGRCPHLLEALADVIANGEKLLAQRRTEVVVGSLLKQKLQFARDEDWRSACRKLLLQRALDLTGRPNNEADRIADFLRDLYKEQALAFGVDAADLQEQTQLPAVLERLIKHVAARTVQQKLAAADKTYLERIDRQLQAARFVAANDPEYVVLLQRIWIKVLILTVRDGAPAPARKMMTTVQEELDKKDREAGNLLDQLRSGEENILRVWALAHDLKLQ